MNVMLCLTVILIAYMLLAKCYFLSTVFTYCFILIAGHIKVSVKGTNKLLKRYTQYPFLVLETRL